jgi:hypothetical protein
MTGRERRVRIVDMWPAARVVLAAVAGAAVLLAQVSLPSKPFWDDHGSKWLYPCIGLLLLQEILIGLSGNLRADAAAEYDRNVLAVLHAAIKATGEQFGIAWDKIGVHVFLAQRRVGRLRLVKIAGARMSSEPSLIRSDWRPGKGIVGIAWRNERLEAVDWQRFVSRARAAKKEGWCGLPESDTLRLSWHEVQSTLRYDGIAAYPMYDERPRLAGCVTLDAPLSIKLLRGDAMLGILNDVAGAVQKAGRPPRAVRARR